MRVWEDLQKGKPTVNENGDSLYLEYLLKDDELGKSLNEAQIKRVPLTYGLTLFRKMVRLRIILKRFFWKELRK